MEVGTGEERGSGAGNVSVFVTVEAVKAEVQEEIATAVTTWTVAGGYAATGERDL